MIAKVIIIVCAVLLTILACTVQEPVVWLLATLYIVKAFITLG